MRVPVRKTSVKQDGFGLIQFASEDVIIYGGFRVNGPVRPDKTRLAFHAFDRQALQDLGQEASKIAYLELTVLQGDPPQIVELVKIDVPKHKRGQGYGERVLAAIVGSTPDGGLEVIDIKPSAIGFWNKMGIVPVAGRTRQLDATIHADFELDYSRANP